MKLEFSHAATFGPVPASNREDPMPMIRLAPEQTAPWFRILVMAVEQSGSAILICDRSGDIVYANPRFFELTGYCEDEVIGNNPRMLQSGQTPAETYRALWENVMRGEPWRGEVRNQKKSGELYWSRLSVAPVKGEDGQVSHFVGIEEDITREKDLELSLERRNRELEKSNRELIQFAGVVSHDLRAPLATIESAIDLMSEQREIKASGDSARLIEAVRRKIISMSRLIKDLLEYSRAQNSELKVEEIDLTLASIEAISNLESVLQEKMGEVRAGSLPKALGNHTLFVQLFQNLIENGLKFNRSERPLVTITCRREGDEWIVCVRDNGIGIPQDEVSQLFEPFTRLNSEFPGTGLGLATCKSIAERHGGRIWVESFEGGGCGICFSLPASGSRPDRGPER